jgi:hypothetical protein
MVNPEPARSDCARLIGLAEAVAELAEQCGHHELAGFAASTARRFPDSVTPVDRVAVALYRREVAGLLRRVYSDSLRPAPRT